MAVSLSPVFNAYQGFTNGGQPLIGGKLYTYLAGTSTPAATYTDNTGLIANTNPIVLDANGRPPNEVWLTSGQGYLFTLKDSTGNLLGTYDNIYGVEIGGADAQLRSDLSASSGSSLVGFIASQAGAVSRTEQSKLRDFVTPQDFGSVGPDATAAFVAANATGTTLVIPDIGVPYIISSDTTLSSPIICYGVLQPAAGVHLNITGAFWAPLKKVFDRSAGGAVQFMSSRVPEVWVEWWGAIGGTGGRTDNQIPIQYACDAVQSIIYADFTTPAPNADNNGGIVNFGYTTQYLCSGHIITRNRVILKGKGEFTVLKANAATWGSDTEVWLSQNGTSSQFYCRAHDMAFDASNITGVACIYAPAWQQDCGLYNCIVQNFQSRGVKFDNAYGGSVGFELRNVLFSYDRVNASNAVKCISIDVDGIFTTGWLKVILDNVQFESGNTDLTGIVDQTGVYAIGRVELAVRAVHGEGIAYICSVDKAASIYGDAIAATGNASVIEVIQVGSNSTGTIQVQGAKKGGATYLLRSFVAGATNIYRDTEPIWDRIIYPHTPSEILVYARNTSNAGTLDANSQGVSSLSRTGPGAYTLNFDTSKFAPTSGTFYRVQVQISSSLGRTVSITAQNSTNVQLQFKDLSGSAADCDLYDVFIYGRPGY